MDRKTFVNLLTGRLEPLRHFLLALCCGDTAMADDIAQDACIKAFMSMDSLKEVDRFGPWLSRIAYNVFLDRHRSARVTEDEDRAAAIAASERSDSAFDYQALYAALERIPDTERAAILLYYIQGYAVREVAAITGAREDAVRKQLSRGREHLRCLLKNSES